MVLKVIFALNSIENNSRSAFNQELFNKYLLFIVQRRKDTSHKQIIIQKNGNYR